MNPDELRERLDELRTQFTELDEEYRGQALPADKQERWEQLETEIKETEELLKEQEFRAKRVKELAEQPEHRSEPEFQVQRPGVARGDEIWDLTTIRSSVGDPEGSVRELRERGKRAVEMSRFSHVALKQEEGQERLSAMVDNLDGDTGDASLHLIRTGSPLYKRAFAKAINKKQLSADEQRAMSLTGEKGGFLLPYELDPTIIGTNDGVINPVRTVATVKQTTQNVWKGVTSAGMTARWREAEGEEAKDASPKFGQPEITAHAAEAFGKWSFEIGQDYGSMAADLATMVTEAKDELEATAFATGTGEKQPTGLVTAVLAAEQEVETATEKVFAPATDLRAVLEALAPRWQSRASWLANPDIYHLVSQAESEGGGPLWQTLNSLQAGVGIGTDGRVPRPLLEYPAYRLSTMQSSVTQEKAIALFGDLSKYYIADRIGMFAKPVENVVGKEGNPTGEEGLLFFFRVGADLVAPTAVQALVVK